LAHRVQIIGEELALEPDCYQCCYADVFSTYAINSWIVSHSPLASSFIYQLYFSDGCTHTTAGKKHRYGTE
jgi:hypothetical protein